MSRPDFIAECPPNRFPNHVGLKAWANQQVSEAKGQGCVYLRTTENPAAVGHVLIEGWKEHPAFTGEPAWGAASE